MIVTSDKNCLFMASIPVGCTQFSQVIWSSERSLATKLYLINNISEWQMTNKLNHFKLMLIQKYLWTCGRRPKAQQCPWQRWCQYPGRWPSVGQRAAFWSVPASSARRCQNNAYLGSKTPQTDKHNKSKYKTSNEIKNFKTAIKKKQETNNHKATQMYVTSQPHSG